MRVLFVHNNFPAQYARLHQFLAQEPGFELVAATLETNQQPIGIPNARYKAHREVAKTTHPYSATFEGNVITAQGAYRAFIALKTKGFTPDIICAHSGWGPSLFVKDVWPDAKVLTFFEWYYHARGTDADFLDPASINDDAALRIRAKNASISMDLAQMDWGLAPTRWQWSQFPPLVRSAISILHDGVDTDLCIPLADATLPVEDCVLRAGEEIVTYVARGMEPYRGFPQFIEALALAQQRRPALQAVILGMDRVAYGAKRKDGKTYKEAMLAEHALDLSRTHFLGLVPHETFRRVLQVSAAHVYLTVPFVLSWSMIEAMSAGALVIGSDTAPVREVIVDGVNGLLTDFFDAARLADRIVEAMENRAAFKPLRAAARRTALERYSGRHLMSCHRQLIVDVAEGRLRAGS